jgi:dTDP-4-amino-4,6-dideoxygalactose transaminase
MKCREQLALLGGPPIRGRFLPYARHEIGDSDLGAVVSTLRGEWLTQGPAVARFEEAIAKAAGAAHAVAFSSGTAALHAACRAAGLGPGDEAITSPLTFAATANAVVYQGAHPVFADIEEATLNIDPRTVAKVATERTKALLTVDFAGLPCDYDVLVPLARERGWVIIADAAHSLGATYRERPVGSLADMTVFSFHPAKIITSGEGGAVVTDRVEYVERLKRFRHHGIIYGDADRPWRYEIEDPGYNYRLSDLHSALGLSQLARMEQLWERRDNLALRYRKMLEHSPFLKMPALPDYGRHAWHLFLVLLCLDRLRADQDRIMTALRAENIGVQLHYPLVHLHPFYRKSFGYGERLCPVAESVERRLMTLPLFPAMTDSDQDDVLKALDKVFSHFSK